MAVTRVDLSVSLEVNDECDGITITDTTGIYSETNLLGYGVSGGPATGDLRSLTIKLNYTSLGTYITYVFTIDSLGVITAATLAMGTATATSILSYLATTDWYNLMLAGFDLSGSYGVTIPTIEDGVYEVEYEITGTVSGTSFAFTTSEQCLNSCAACCCITKLWLEIDPNCKDCFEEKITHVMTGDAYLSIAKYAVNVGDLDKAVTALTNAQTVCDCDDCGC